MSILPWTLESSDVQAVTATSVKFDPTMYPGAQFYYVATVDSWITTGADPTAAVADNSVFVKAGDVFPVAAHKTAVKVAAVKATGASDGSGCLYFGKYTSG